MVRRFAILKGLVTAASDAAMEPPLAWITNAPDGALAAGRIHGTVVTAPR